MRHHEQDGGPYVDMASVLVDRHNGIYNLSYHRMEIKSPNLTSMLVVPRHTWKIFKDHEDAGLECPVATVLGHHPAFNMGAAYRGMYEDDEYEMIGAYLQEPLRLVPSDTWGDRLLVPADAEVVIEGFISDDPATYESEGPFGEFTGYVSDLPTPRPTMKISCITHRRDPIFNGSLEGTLPGSYSENSVMSSVQRAAIAWNILNGAGIPGILDVFAPPITNGVNIRIQIKKHYQGQPKQIAAALWGNSAAQYRYKHVIVVEEDIDPADDEQVEWAYAHRVNAGEGGVVIFPGLFGSPIDPSTPMEDRDVAQLGTGLWNRMLIDATRSWKNPRRKEWGGERFPPTVRPAPEDEARVRQRWSEYGLDDL
jgi:UbiD family decarboxylase